jgi:hypothetical protein
MIKSTNFGGKVGIEPNPKARRNKKSLKSDDLRLYR